MFLENKNIYLREVRLSDVDNNYYSWLNDSDTRAFLETRFIPQSINNIEEYVKSLDGNKDEIFFAICLLENDEHIGNIKIGPINWYHRIADISYFIGRKELWGKGYACEAIECIIKFATVELNLHKLRAGCYASNVGSSKVLKKTGFVNEGTLKKGVFYNGKYEDALIFGLIIS